MQLKKLCFFQMQQQSQLASLEAKAKQSAQNAERIRRERDEALREVQHLKKLLKKKEEECLTSEEELMKARRVRALWDWNISSCLTPFFYRAIFKLGQVQNLSKTSFNWMRILSLCHGLHSYPITSWNLNKIPMHTNPSKWCYTRPILTHEGERFSNPK